MTSGLRFAIIAVGVVAGAAGVAAYIGLSVVSNLLDDVYVPVGNLFDEDEVWLT